MATGTRGEIEKLMRAWGCKGAIINHGRCDWQVIDVTCSDTNGFLRALRKKYPFPKWIINAAPPLNKE